MSDDALAKLMEGTKKRYLEYHEELEQLREQSNGQQRALFHMEVIATVVGVIALGGTIYGFIAQNEQFQKSINTTHTQFRQSTQITQEQFRAVEKPKLIAYLYETKPDPENKEKLIPKHNRLIRSAAVNSYLKILKEEGIATVDLSGADLSSVDLTKADLRGAYLVDTNFNAAILHKTNLTGANLAGAKLAAASLLDANLSGARLEKADLTGAFIWGADLQNSKCDRTTKLIATSTNSKTQLSESCNESFQRSGRALPP